MIWIQELEAKEGEDHFNGEGTTVHKVAIKYLFFLLRKLWFRWQMGQEGSQSCPLGSKAPGPPKGAHLWPAFELKLPRMHQGPNLTCPGEAKGRAEAASCSPRQSCPQTTGDRSYLPKAHGPGAHTEAEHQETIPSAMRGAAGTVGGEDAEHKKTSGFMPSTASTTIPSRGTREARSSRPVAPCGR